MCFVCCDCQNTEVYGQMSLKVKLYHVRNVVNDNYPLTYNVPVISSEVYVVNQDKTINVQA